MQSSMAPNSGEDNKLVVLITGCVKGGIGYEYCQAFSSLGCRVVATDVPDRVPDLSGLHADQLPLDVTSDESVAAALERVLTEHGRVDVLVNNAGIGCTGPLAELRGDAVRCAMDVNFLGQLWMVRAMVPHMASSGRVVSTAATPGAGPYCSSKAAVHAATDALLVELRAFGVHVVKVVPGAVRSGLGHANTAQLAGGGAGVADREDIAAHVARWVMSPRPPREIVCGNMTVLLATPSSPSASTSTGYCR